MRSLAFASIFILLFGLTYAFLGAVDSLPEPRGTTVREPTQDEPTETPELPVRVVVKDIGIDWEVLNPTTLDVDELNKTVDAAPMRWPTSAQLGQKGTVALFGHSSHLPIVHNQAFKAFNNIEKLREGQTISVYSATHEYRYAVVKVYLANANEDVVELPSDSRYLTLITCDNFGVKTDRFVVTANFVGQYAL